MYGLLFLIIGGFYFAVVAGLLFWVKPKWGKGLVLVVAILIPNADDWYYRYDLAQYCKNEAGFRVYQQVSHKEGLVDQAMIYGDDFLKSIPVAYVEWPEKHGDKVSVYWRSDRLPDSSVSKPYKVSQYSASYESVRIEKKLPPYTEVKQQVQNRKDGTVLGELKGLFYYGGWYPRLLVGTGGLVAGCAEGGAVVSNREWRSMASGAYRADSNDRDELIRQIFSKQ